MEGLRTGLFAAGHAISEQRQAITVLATAVRQDGLETVVQVVEGGRVETRPVVAGLIWLGRREIREGLAEGEAVIARSGAFFNYAVSDPSRSIEELSRFVDDVIARELQLVDGVGKVSRTGGAEREIKADLDPDRLLALALMAADVSTQLLSTLAAGAAIWWAVNTRSAHWARSGAGLGVVRQIKQAYSQRHAIGSGQGWHIG